MRKLAPLILLFALVSCETTGPLRLRARLHDVQGLRTGAVVQISGVRVGTVAAIKEIPGAGFTEITLDFPAPAPPLPDDARVKLVRAYGSGECFIDLNLAKTKGKPAINGDLLPTEN